MQEIFRAHPIYRADVCFSLSVTINAAKRVHVIIHQNKLPMQFTLIDTFQKI